MKRLWMLVLAASVLTVSCRTDDGVVTVKEGVGKKAQGGETLLEEACDHAITMMRKEFGDDMALNEVGETADDMRRDCMEDMKTRYSEDEADEMARCVLEATDISQFSKCEPGKGRPDEKNETR